MSTRWYVGSCQCGRVKFQAAIDLETQLAKTADRADPNAYVLIHPEAFRLASGEGDLADIQFGPVFGLNRFCRHCGVRVFGKGHLARLGGDFCAVGLAALDGALAPEEEVTAAQ